MASLLTKLDPRNINWEKSPHKVTPEISAKNDAKIDKLEKEQKLLSSKLKSGAYKNTNDLNAAWQLQNRSFQKIVDHRNAWDETTPRHPRVNKQREIEKDRFMGKAIAIQTEYENIISEQAQKQGVCGYLSKKTCSKGKDCYWFGSENVRGKDTGCYSRKEARKNWSVKPIKRSKKTNLPILGEEERRITIPMIAAAKARLSRLPEQQSMSENPEEKKEGGRTRKKRRKRKTRCKKRKRKKTRRRTKRRTKRKRRRK